MQKTGRAAPAKAEITPASVWRRVARDGELYRLPGSGNVVRLRRPGLTALAANVGHIPNPLSREVLRLMSAAETPTSEDAKIEAFQRSARAYVEVAALCFVEPRIALEGEPGEGEISPADVPDQDLVWCYWTFLEGDAVVAGAFRVDA